MRTLLHLTTENPVGKCLEAWRAIALLVVVEILGVDDGGGLEDVGREVECRTIVFAAMHNNDAVLEHLGSPLLDLRGMDGAVAEYQIVLGDTECLLPVHRAEALLDIVLVRIDSVSVQDEFTLGVEDSNPADAVLLFDHAVDLVVLELNVDDAWLARKEEVEARVGLGGTRWVLLAPVKRLPLLGLVRRVRDGGDSHVYRVQGSRRFRSWSIGVLG